MAHQSNRVTPFTHGLIQTAKRNETHGMDARSPKSLKVVLGRGEWFVRKPHLFQDDVKQCESVLCLFRLPALFVCCFEPIKITPVCAQASVSSICCSIFILSCYFHTNWPQEVDENIFLHSILLFGFGGNNWKVAEKPFQAATLQFAGKVLLGP